MSSVWPTMVSVPPLGYCFQLPATSAAGLGRRSQFGRVRGKEVNITGQGDGDIFQLAGMVLVEPSRVLVAALVALRELNEKFQFEGQDACPSVWLAGEVVSF